MTSDISTQHSCHRMVRPEACTLSFVRVAVLFILLMTIILGAADRFTPPHSKHIISRHTTAAISPPSTVS